MKKVKQVPYDRIIQWLSGPVSIVAGLAATFLITHVKIFGALGIGHNQLAQVITAVGVFAVSAGVTYAGHHKWLTNVPKWWAHSGVGIPWPTTPSTTSPIPGPPPGTPVAGPPSTGNTGVQPTPGTPGR